MFQIVSFQVDFQSFSGNVFWNFHKPPIVPVKFPCWHIINIFAQLTHASATNATHEECEPFGIQSLHPVQNRLHVNKYWVGKQPNLWMFGTHVFSWTTVFMLSQIRGEILREMTQNTSCVLMMFSQNPISTKNSLYMLFSLCPAQTQQHTCMLQDEFEEISLYSTSIRLHSPLIFVSVHSIGCQNTNRFKWQVWFHQSWLHGYLLSVLSVSGWIFELLLARQCTSHSWQFMNVLDCCHIVRYHHTCLSVALCVVSQVRKEIWGSFGFPLWWVPSWYPFMSHCVEVGQFVCCDVKWGIWSVLCLLCVVHLLLAQCGLGWPDALFSQQKATKWSRGVRSILACCHEHLMVSNSLTDKSMCEASLASDCQTKWLFQSNPKQRKITFWFCSFVWIFTCDFCQLVAKCHWNVFIIHTNR